MQVNPSGSEDSRNNDVHVQCGCGWGRPTTNRHMDTMWAATRDVPLSVLISPPPAGTFGCFPQVPNNIKANGCHPSYLPPMALLQSAKAFAGASAALASDTSGYRGRVERAWMANLYTVLWRWDELRSYHLSAYYTVTPTQHASVYSHTARTKSRGIRYNVTLHATWGAILLCFCCAHDRMAKEKTSVERSRYAKALSMDWPLPSNQEDAFEIFGRVYNATGTKSLSGGCGLCDLRWLHSCVFLPATPPCV